MTEEVIFQKAMEKAQANGLKLYFSYRQMYQKILNKELPFWLSRAFIFWIPFAKAFWGEDYHIPGEDTRCKECGSDSGDFCWQHYMEQMIFEESPYEYLALFLSYPSEVRKEVN
jgi:hypothetical protein